MRNSRKASVVGEEQTRARLEDDEARNGMGGWWGCSTRMAVVTLSDVGS